MGLLENEEKLKGSLLKIKFFTKNWLKKLKNSTIKKGQMLCS